MYSFVDTIESVSPAHDIPAEAICINGTWLDVEIEGYRTLSVSGRELTQVEVDTFDVGTTDGAHIRSRRIPERTITVQYQILAADAYAFARAYAKLNSLLSVREAQIIFADEPDRYFVGTPLVELEPPEAGRLNAVASFDILCADPFRYSIQEYSAAPGPTGLASVDYDGTYPAHPVLEATAASDLGVVAFIDGEGHIIQVGDPDETDGETAQRSETVINNSFKSSIPSGWTANAIPDFYTQEGSLARTSDGMYAESYGPDNEDFHGVSAVRIFPADSSSRVGAECCTVEWDFRFYTPDVTQVGWIVFLLLGEVDGTEVIIASIHVRKPFTTNPIGKVYEFIRSQQKLSLDFTTDQYNGLTGQNGKGKAIISKFGNTFTFNFCGISSQFVYGGSETMVVKKAAVYFAQKGSIPPVSNSFVSKIKATVHNVTTWTDVPDKFGDGDVIEADTASGEIAVNGLPMQGLGALGNDWETFRLFPGENTVMCCYSDWASRPDFRIRYRKVWL